ncbi:DUF6273 domain-containing protein [Paenibacillus sp. CN-4]|uniref:DUF6273 domain-containing protein n=1 Tax=Paenibacillus nanchangensis TaxID=3348343 RepID=UPI0039792F71
MGKGSFTFTPNRSFEPGEKITFGQYPQSEDGSKLPIVWRILEISGSKCFLLSEDILDCKRYHGKSADVTWRDSPDITWQDCDLRKWLNDEFYHAAFSAAEQEYIATVHCTDNGADSPDTEDKVFVLSVAELERFSELHGRELRRAVGTDFAKLKKADGCSLYVYDKSNKENYIVRDGKEAACSWWWLRTRGNKPSRAYFVGPGCSIRSYANVSLARDGVRPALILRLP